MDITRAGEQGHRLTNFGLHAASERRTDRGRTRVRRKRQRSREAICDPVINLREIFAGDTACKWMPRRVLVTNRTPASDAGSAPTQPSDRRWTRLYAPLH